MRLLIFVGILATTLPAPSQAREPIRLKPTSNWHLDYADDSCRLARKFGTGDDEIMLLLDQFEPGDSFHMIVAGSKLRPKTATMFLDVSLRFGPDEEDFETKVTPGDLGTKRALIFSGERIAALTDTEKALADEHKKTGVPVTLPPIGNARESAVRWVEIKGATRDNLILEVGPMSKALDALRACSWDTVKLWGLDVEEQKTLSRAPIATRSLDTWFSADDYPKNLVLNGVQGNVNFRLIIDEAGKIESCNIQKSTRPMEFDELVCKLATKRGRFKPALDAAGKPVRSYYRQTIAFRIQG